MLSKIQSEFSSLVWLLGPKLFTITFSSCLPRLPLPLTTQLITFSLDIQLDSDIRELELKYNIIDLALLLKIIKHLGY